MNLAFIGFLVTGVVFFVYASTFYGLAGKKLPLFLKNYSFAYFSLGLAFVFWSFAVLRTDFLVKSILVGNILLLFGSLFLVAVLLHAHKNLKILAVMAGVVLSVAFMWFRVTYYMPMPFMSNGILIFNTQKIIAEILGLIFILIWLPANLVVAKTVVSAIGIKTLSFVYSFIYVLSTVSAILFISFKTSQMVILSFISLSICFVMLLYSNYVITKLIPHKT